MKHVVLNTSTITKLAKCKQFSLVILKLVLIIYKKKINYQSLGTCDSIENLNLWNNSVLAHCKNDIIYRLMFHLGDARAHTFLLAIYKKVACWWLEVIIFDSSENSPTSLK